MPALPKTHSWCPWGHDAKGALSDLRESNTVPAVRASSPLNLGAWGDGNTAIIALTPLEQLLACAQVKQEENKSQFTESVQVNARTQTFGGAFPFFQVSSGL